MQEKKFWFSRSKDMNKGRSSQAMEDLEYMGEIQDSTRRVMKIVRTIPEKFHIPLERILLCGNGAGGDTAVQSLVASEVGSEFMGGVCVNSTIVFPSNLKDKVSGTSCEFSGQMDASALGLSFRHKLDPRSLLSFSSMAKATGRENYGSYATQPSC